MEMATLYLYFPFVASLMIVEHLWTTASDYYNPLYARRVPPYKDQDYAQQVPADNDTNYAQQVPADNDTNYGRVVSELRSVHSNRRGDRKWQVLCQNIAYPYYVSYMGLSVWSYFVNDLDKPMDFQCQQGNVITGIYSIRNDKHADRRYKFKCTYVANWKRGNCQWSLYTTLDAAWNRNTPRGKFLVGVKSDRDKSKRDRTFSFLYC